MRHDSYRPRRQRIPAGDPVIVAMIVIIAASCVIFFL
jgi:hypothetical protein